MTNETLIFLQYFLQKRPLRGVPENGCFWNNKTIEGLDMLVGGGGRELYFGKVAGFKPVALLENGLFCGCFFLENFA